MYICKGNTADEKFDEFQNTLGRLDKIRDGKIPLADAKNDQAEFKSKIKRAKKKRNV